MSQRFLLAMLLLFLVSPHVHAQQVTEPNSPTSFRGGVPPQAIQVTESTEQTATSTDALPAGGFDSENVTEFEVANPRNSNVTEFGGAIPPNSNLNKPGGENPRNSNVTKPGGGGAFPTNSNVTKPRGGDAFPTNSNVTELRRRFEQLDQECRAVTGKLKGPISDSAERGKLEASLHDRVRQAFVVRQQLRQAELADFAKRLGDLQRSIELRDRNAEKIIVRRVEELLDPNLEWDAANGAAEGARIFQGETATQQQAVTKKGKSTFAASPKGGYEMRIPAKGAPTVKQGDGDEFKNDVSAPV